MTGNIHFDVHRIKYKKLIDQCFGEPLSAIQKRVDAADRLHYRERFGDGAKQIANETQAAVLGFVINQVNYIASLAAYYPLMA